MSEYELSLDGLARAARRYADAHGARLEDIPEVAKRQEGVDFGMFAAITGFNEHSCRQKSYQR